MPKRGNADAETIELSVSGPKIGRLLDCFLIILILQREWSYIISIIKPTSKKW